MAIAETPGVLSDALRLVEIEGRGRALVASQPLKGGQIVLRDSPILTYSAFLLKQRHPQNTSSTSSTYCAHCYRCLGSPSTLACPSCSDVAFCSPKCQSLATTSTHTPWVCQSLSHLRNCPSLVNHQSDERQVQARYLVAAYNLAMVSPPAFQTLMSLDGGGGARGEPEIALFLHSIISSLPFPEGVSPPSAEVTLALLAKDRCNAFGLMEPFSENKERSVRAYGIYPNASFFNHDCLPNACRFDYVDSPNDGNTDIVIRMIHDIPQGREVCLSYFPVNVGYSERQRRLAEDYGFSCCCDRCKVEANWSNEDDDDDAMKEEEEENMEGSEGENNEIEQEEGGDIDNDFPHAYFFVRFVCDRENCGGTLAPLPPANGSPSDVMECNVCGKLKKDEM